MADGLDALSVSQLRSLLRGAQVNTEDCVEKASGCAHRGCLLAHLRRTRMRSV